MKKKVVSISMVVALLACVVAGTLAYFTDTAVANNTFTVGDLHIAVNEKPVVSYDDNGVTKWKVLNDTSNFADRVTENKYENIYPGANLPKDPKVWNVGTTYNTFSKWTDDNKTAITSDAKIDASEYPAYICVGVTISDYNTFATAAAAERIDSDLTKIFNGYDSSKWQLAFTPKPDTDNDKVTYYYYYKTAVKPDEATVPLFTSVTIPAGMNNADLAALATDGFTIDINAYAVQVGDLTSVKEAFNAEIAKGSFASAGLAATDLFTY